MVDVSLNPNTVNLIAIFWSKMGIRKNAVHFIYCSLGKVKHEDKHWYSVQLLLLSCIYAYKNDNSLKYYCYMLTITSE